MIVIVVILLLYAISIVWTRVNLTTFSKGKKIQIIVSGILMAFVISLILVFFKPIQIEDSVVGNKLNRINLGLFSALNTLLIVPTISRTFNQYKGKEITKKQFQNRLFLKIGMILILLLIEISLLDSMQNTISLMYQNRKMIL